MQSKSQKAEISDASGAPVVSVPPALLSHESLLERVKKLRQMTDVQCSSGNWNFDPYMHGMANGMIFALSLFDDKEPDFLAAPIEWLADRKRDGAPTIADDTSSREVQS